MKSSGYPRIEDCIYNDFTFGKIHTDKSLGKLTFDDGSCDFVFQDRIGNQYYVGDLKSRIREEGLSNFDIIVDCRKDAEQKSNHILIQVPLDFRNRVDQNIQILREIGRAHV